MKFNLDVVGSPNFRGVAKYDPSDVLDQIGLTFLGLVRRNFRAGLDPYGQSWAPLKSRDGQPLLHSGRLLKSIGYSVRGKELVIGSNLIYAATHNQGFRYTPQRQFIPDSTNPPQAWLDVATRAFQKDIQAHVSRIA